jgi:hypothetical protein
MKTHLAISGVSGREMSRSVSENPLASAPVFSVAELALNFDTLAINQTCTENIFNDFPRENREAVPRTKLARR